MGSRIKKEEKNEKLIRALSKLNENKKCINCNTLVPQYVCTNFWTFVCLTCSGIHREFTHRVKSISMSKFTAAEVTALHSGGNQRAREIYLKNWDFQRNSLPDSSNVERLRAFIKHVYVDRRYAAEGFPPRNRVVSSAGSVSGIEEYGRFSVDRRYPEDILDTGRLSLSSKRGNGTGDTIRRLSNYRCNNDEADISGRLSNYRGNNDPETVKRSSSYSENDNFESIRRPSNYSESEGGDGMRRPSNYGVGGDTNDVRRPSNYRGISDEDSTGRLSYHRGNCDGDSTGCLSIYRGHSDGDSTGRLSNYRGSEDGDGLRHFCNYSGNDEGDIVRHYSIRHGNNEGDTPKRPSSFKGAYNDNNEDQNQRPEVHLSNYERNCPGRNSPQYGGRGTLSDALQRAESKALPSGQGKHIDVAKFASFGNGAPLRQNLAVFKRANSDSLIDFGAHGSIPDKGTRPDLFGIQGSSSVNEGWATFDMHPSAPPRQVGSSGGNPVYTGGTTEKQNSEVKAPVQPTFGTLYSTTQLGNGSLSGEQLSQLPFSQEIAQQWSPFPSTISLFEDSNHQSGSAWIPYNTSMTANSDSDRTQQEKESCSNFIQQPKSRNPFDLPEDYVASSGSLVNTQFPSMGTLEAVLPALSFSPSTVLPGSNLTSGSLSSDWALTGMGAHQAANGSSAGDHLGHMSITSFPVQTAAFGVSIGNLNSHPSTVCVGSTSSSNLGLQTPVQSTSQPFRSNNPFD